MAGATCSDGTTSCAFGDRADEHRRVRSAVGVENRSSAIEVVAVQGPRSVAAMLSAGVEMDPDLGYFRAAPAKAAGAEVPVARLGYTGELGYEVFAPTAAAIELRRALTRAGVTPCGADALQSLRIERETG